MFFVVFDEEFKEHVINTYKNDKQLVETLYTQFTKLIENILADNELPAKLASYVFFGEPSGESAMALRLVAALYDLLLRSCHLPLWVSFADLDLADKGKISLVYVFSNASRVEGLKGRVIVAQFSDGDEEVELSYSNGKIKMTSLRGALSLFVTIARFFGRNPMECFKNFLKNVNQIIAKIKSEKASPQK